MLLYLSILGVLLSILLLYYNAKKYTSSIYLGIFFILVSVYGINHYVFIYSPSVEWICFMYVHTTFLSYLTGPMAFFYVRSIIRDDAKLYKKDLIHFAPAIIHLLVSLPYIFEPLSHKWEVATSIAADASFLFQHKANLITKYTNAFTAMYISRPILAMIYTIASLIIWIKYCQRNKPFILSQQRTIKRWINSFLSFQLLLFVGLSLVIWIDANQHNSATSINMNVMHIINTIALVGLILTPFLFPQILYGLPNFSADIRLAHLNSNNNLSDTKEYSLPDITQFSDIKQDAQKTTEEIEEEDNSILPSKLQLDLSYVAILSKDVDDFMESKQLFLDSSINMLKMAHLMNIPAHHLGYVFREYKKVSFNDYRNNYRIEYAIQLIKEGLTDNLTLEAIGIQSGFASRSAFQKSFKRVTGLSPREFVGKE